MGASDHCGDRPYRGARIKLELARRPRYRARSFDSAAMSRDVRPWAVREQDDWQLVRRAANAVR